MTSKILHAPLEQFQIISLTNCICFKYIFTNLLLISSLSVFVFIFLVYYNSPKNKKNLQFITSYLYFVPNIWQKIVEIIPEIVSNIALNFLNYKNEKYFPVILTIFNFILFSNLTGLLPYSFTVTSHLFVTFTISLTVFIGMNIIVFEKYKEKSFSLFLPANTPFFLALLLVPIEFISYLAKPISLGARLFINLMAGHSTLKIAVSFAWSLLLLQNFLSFGFIIPSAFLIVLFVLELGVALIQTYVFIVLTCIYIKDIS